MNKNQHCCFIINSILPYRYDINQIVALPSGFTYRNRWAERWVDPSLFDDIANLENKPVLLILRDFDQDRLIPLRWGRLYLAQRIGTIFYFEYELEDFVRYGADATKRTHQVEGFNRAFHSYHPENSSAPREGIEPSVFLSGIGSELERATFDDFDNWGNVVNAVGTVKAYEAVEFLKIVGTTSLDKNPAKIHERHYELQPNAVYEMRLFQFIPNPGEGELEPHDIELNTSSKQIMVLQERQRAVGKYDMLRFVFRVEDLRHGESSFIEVLHKPHPKSSGFALPSLYLPVVIKRGWRSANIIRFLVTATALVFTFSPDFFGLIKIDAEWVRSLAIVLFVLTIMGWRRVWEAFWR